VDVDAVDHPRFLPGMLVPEADGERRRRTTRDWTVDVVSFLLCLLCGFGVLALELDAGFDGPLVVVDIVLGVFTLGLLWVRRRWPVAVGVLSLPAAALSALGSFASAFLLFNLAVHRRWPAAVALGLAQIAVSPVYNVVLHPDEDLPWWVIMAVVVALTAAIVAWGMFVRSRRQLVVSLRDRNERLESEQALRVEQARQAERTRIAREMHDVLAHRISLVSLHAGALEFRPDAPEEEVARAAGVIRASAHQALIDLREIIGVLRDTTSDDAEGVPEPPQPTLAQLPALLAESREAGMHIHAELTVDPLDGVPQAVGRSALRIVQEGLTNARKHAPAARVDVLVSGAPGDGLVVEVRNPTWIAAGRASTIPGAGTGLIGMTERAVLAGGRLEHGYTPDGDFRLRAWLPWPA
jgi:signal transduction histidine kinase